MRFWLFPYLFAFSKGTTGGKKHKVKAVAQKADELAKEVDKKDSDFKKDTIEELRRVTK